MVSFTFRVEQYVQEVLRVRIVGLPAESVNLEIAAVQVLKVRRPFDLLYLHLHAERILPHLQDYLHVDSNVTARTRYRQDYARAGCRVGVLGHLQLRLGCLLVKLQSLKAIRVAGESRRQYAVCRNPKAGKHLVGNEFLVDCEVQRPPEMNIVEWRFVNVESDVGHAESGRRDLQFLGQRFIRVLKPFEVEDAHARDVYFIILVEGHRLSAREIEHYSVYVCRLTVEVVVALQNQMLADLVLFQHEGPSGIWGVRPPVTARLDVGPVNHKGSRIGELREEVRLGRIDRKFDSSLVDSSDATDFGRFAVQDLSHAHDVTQICASDGGSKLRIRRSVERVHEVLRRNRLAVRELGVGQQVECIDRPVLAYLPPFGDVRHYLQVRVQGNEPTIDLTDDERRRGVGRLVRVESRRVAEEPCHRAADRPVSFSSRCRCRLRRRSGRSGLNRDAGRRSGFLRCLLSHCSLGFGRSGRLSRLGLSGGRGRFRLLRFWLARATSQCADSYNEHGDQQYWNQEQFSHLTPLCVDFLSSERKRKGRSIVRMCFRRFRFWSLAMP